ncbi:hypothetical protein [Mesorhizobium sp. 1B3]|uniref:hypothetical protein n=1 Tax=Mesorhizobium sp. 1B3 TaxID=3243599 RepID=UPI003D98D444
MPGSIYDWSKTAGQNDTADADIDWREGMFADAVNDSGRQMMGRNAEFRDDITGTLTATGTANALLLTANSSFTSLANGRKLTFRAAANNSGPASINVNGLGSKKIRAMGASGDVDIAANDLQANGVYTLVYSSTADTGTGAWILYAPLNKTIDGNKVDAFPAGTRLPFQQSTAPVGWVKVTDHDNAALRIVNGTVTTGGTVAFTTAFASQSVGATAITAAQMPSHTHGFAGTTSAASNDHTHGFVGTGGTDVQGVHGHNFQANTGQVVGNISAVTNDIDENTTYQGSTNPTGAFRAFTIQGSGAHAHNVTVSGTTGGISANHTHTYSGTTTGAGSGATHTHTLDIAVKYVDFIIAEKAA